MNPIVLAGLFGLAKGFAAGSGRGAARTHQRGLGETVLGAALEETWYRAVPHGLSQGRFHDALGAAWFALDHVVPEAQNSNRSNKQHLARFADVFAGGLLYSHAYRRYGFFGSLAAHVAHNLACRVGQR